MEISNEHIKMSVQAAGAELTSLMTVKDGVELLWQGDPAYWAKQSPLLFPVVGGLPDGKFEHNGTLYEMGQHGFARTSEFELVDQSTNSLCYKLSSNAETLSRYPFEFELFVRYTLDGSKLRVSYRVCNQGEGPMFFSIGAHPGFKCPIFEGEKMEDYSLVFEQPETVQSRVKKGTLLTGEKIDFLNGSDRVRLSHELFHQGAAILGGVRSQWVELRSSRNAKTIRVEFDGFPYLGIWSSMNDGPFVCIEPWFGVDSTAGEGYGLAEKEGILRLNPKEIFECEYRILAE